AQVRLSAARTVDLSPGVLAASTAAAMSIGLVVRMVAPPPRRLRSRIGPCLSPHVPNRGIHRGGSVSSVFGPVIQDMAHRLGAWVDRSGREASALKLRQAGWYPGHPEGEALTRYRVLQLRTLTVSLGLALVLGWVVGATPAVRLVLVGLGGVIGVTRTRGRLDRAIDDRREKMKIEIYTVNQLLAMRVRAGGGVIQAVKGITQRGQGEVVA